MTKQSLWNVYESAKTALNVGLLWEIGTGRNMTDGSVDFARSFKELRILETYVECTFVWFYHKIYCKQIYFTCKVLHFASMIVVLIILLMSLQMCNGLASHCFIVQYK